MARISKSTSTGSPGLKSEQRKVISLVSLLINSLVAFL